MATAALAGYLALLIGAFGVRTVLHRRRTGKTGWLSPPTTAARVGDIFFTLGVAGTVAAPVLQLVGAVDRFAVLDHAVVQTAGLVPLAGGAGVALIAQAQMGEAWRAGVEVTDRYEIVRRGLFSLVRNPFYLGILTASAGVTLMAPNSAVVAAWVMLLAGCHIEVRLVEEPHLRSVHGEAFDAYARSVPRFLPWPGPRPAQNARGSR